jgi:hypothetical protein
VIDPDDPPRTWTVAEANAVLEHVQAVVADAKAAIAAHVERAKVAGTAAGGNGHAPSGGGEPASVRAAVAELDRMGILLRDPGRGLVDFPARAPSGRPYWLCWLDGEPTVEWWHWVEDGFAGRTSVDQLPE